MVAQAQHITDDPLDSAMSAEARPRTNDFFGQVDLDVWYCTLQKGVGKRQFDASIDKLEHRRTAIKITIAPLPDSPAKFEMTRDMIAESDEWTKFVKPSLAAIGTDLRALKSRWAHIQTVPTGETYTNKTGETKEKTTFKFIAAFDTEDACRAAAAKVFGPRSEAAPLPPDPAAAPSAGNERANAAKFLAPLWKTSGGDLTVFAAKIAATAPLNKLFDMSSPEVIAVVSA